MNPHEPAPPDGPTPDELRHPDAARNRAAWDLAYPRLWRAALSLAHHLLSGPEHAQNREDLASRAVTELVRGVVENSLPSFNQMSTFGDVVSMTQQIVRARTKDFFRARGRRPEDLTGEVPDAPAEDSASAAALSWDECLELIRELPPPQPEIFDLHYAQGHTAEEIAVRLSMPRSTVLSHLFRGKKTLRQKLGGRDSEDGDHSTAP